MVESDSPTDPKEVELKDVYEKPPRKKKANAVNRSHGDNLLLTRRLGWHAGIVLYVGNLWFIFIYYIPLHALDSYEFW